MAEETLLSAARRALRFFRIDEAHGGLTSTETLARGRPNALSKRRLAEHEHAISDFRSAAARASCLRAPPAPDPRGHRDQGLRRGTLCDRDLLRPKSRRSGARRHPCDRDKG